METALVMTVEADVDRKAELLMISIICTHPTDEYLKKH